MGKLRTPTKAETEALEEVDAAARYFIQVAKKHKAHVAGFVWGSDPLIVFNFGTCDDMSSPKLYTALCSLVEEGKQRGTTIRRSASGQTN